MKRGLCLILLALALTACSSGAGTVPTEMEIVYNWPAYTLDEAIESADLIVYGKISEKSHFVSRTDNGVDLIEHDLKVSVLRVLKSSADGSDDLTEIIYHEIPGHIDELGSERHDIPVNLDLGDEAILFLNPASRALAPSFILPVKNAVVELRGDLIQAGLSDSEYMAFDAFVERIRQDRPGR